jgi:hypothetical protein
MTSLWTLTLTRVKICVFTNCDVPLISILKRGMSELKTFGERTSYTFHTDG